MINIKKVAKEIRSDGRYDALLDTVKEKLKDENPSIESIEKLISEDNSYIVEYKDLNRWGEISSVHIKKLEIKADDSKEAIDTKELINKDIDYLIIAEEFEIPSKKVIYFVWAGFISVSIVYVIDNIIRIATDLYLTNESHIYFPFAVVFTLTAIGYFKVINNHEKEHKRYLKIQQQMRKLIRTGLEKGYFSYNEVYKGG